ncbi:MAG: serine/threonine-protein kinase [Gemmatimonadota bacterium]|nr:serine/threonine-protein kinase [Gemmatimonadota bacterium]
MVSEPPASSGEPSFDDYVRDELSPDFRVVRTLGRGSVANVYLAKDVALDQLRAIKVLVPSKSIDATARKRFAREARSAAKINHPHVTNVYRVGTLSDETPFLVMEYVDGRNLEDVIEGGGPLPESEAREVLRQLAEGLAAAHAVGIIHRDLKPANILRESASGDVRLTDFGVAAVRDAAGTETTRLTVQGQILGEVEYVAPEHLMSEELTELADIYSLGVIGYRLLTGKTPYPNARNAQIISEKLRSPPTPLAVLDPKIDPDLAALLEQCLARKPEHRPSAADIVARLRPPATAARDGQAATDQPQDRTPLEAFFAEVKRRRVYRVAVGYVAFAAVVIGILDGVSEPLDIPDGAQQLIIVLTLAGLPLALTLSWVFDIRQGRIERTADAALEGGQRVGRILPVLALIASFILAALGVWWAL